MSTFQRILRFALCALAVVCLRTAAFADACPGGDGWKICPGLPLGIARSCCLGVFNDTPAPIDPEACTAIDPCPWCTSRVDGAVLPTSPYTVTPGGDFKITCDYGIPSGCITVGSPGAQSCTFAGFTESQHNKFSVSIIAAGMSNGIQQHTMQINDPIRGTATSLPVTVKVFDTPKTAIKLNTTSLSFTAAQNGSVPLPQYITITNVGSPDSALNWKLTTPAPFWFSITPTPAKGGPLAGTDMVGNTIAITIKPSVLSVTSPPSHTLVFVDANDPSVTASLTVTLSILPTVRPIIQLVPPTPINLTAKVGRPIANGPVLNVFNAGTPGSILNWETHGQKNTDSGIGWLNVNPIPSGTPPLTPGQPHSIGVDIKSELLTVGTHSGAVVVSDPSGNATAVTIPITLTITASAQPALALDPPSLTFVVNRNAGNPVPQTVTVINSGTTGGLYDSLVDWSIFAPGLPSWLPLPTPNHGGPIGTTGTSALFLCRAGQTPGTYNNFCQFGLNNGQPGCDLSTTGCPVRSGDLAGTMTIATPMAQPPTANITNVTKSASGGGTGSPLPTISYTIGFDNAGPAVATTPNVVDSLDPHLAITGLVTYQITGGPSGNCSPNGSTICVLPDLAAGRHATVSFTVQPDQSGCYTNTAGIWSENDLETAPDHFKSATTPTTTCSQQGPSLTVSKTDAKDTSAAQPTITYTLSVANPAGGSPVSNATLTDNLQSGMTLVSGSIINNAGINCVPSGSGISCTLPSPFNGGSTSQVTFKATHAPVSTPNTCFQNSASVSATGLTTPITSNVTTTCFDPPTSNLSLAKSAVTVTGTSLPTIDFTLTANNAIGAANASNAVVSDTLPSGWTLVPGSVANSAGVSCTPGASSISCNLQNPFPAGGSAQIAFRATHARVTVANTCFDNSATLNAQGLTSPVQSNTTTNCFDPPASGLAISKTAVADPAASQPTMTFTLDVSNANSAPDADNAIVVDNLQSGMTLVPGSISNTAGTTCTPTASGISCSLPTPFTAGNTAQITFKATHVNVSNPNTCFQNSAAVSATGVSPITSNTTSTCFDPLPPSLSVAKSDSKDTAAAQPTVTYTLNVSNSASAGPAHVVTLVDNLPSGMTLVPGSVTSPAGTTCNPTAVGIFCALPDPFDPGASAQISFTATHVPVTAANTCFDNNASVAAQGVSPIPSNTTTTCFDPPAAIMSIVKTATTDTAATQPTIHYTLDVTNANGTADATNVVLTDALQGGLSLVSGSLTASAGTTCTPTGNDISCTLPNPFVGGANAQISFTATHAPVTAVNTCFDNSASLTLDGQASPVTSNTTSSCFDPANLAITKTGQIQPTTGASLTPIVYTIIVSNDPGAAIAIAPHVTDNLPANLTLVGTPTLVPASAGACSASAGGFTCDLNDLIGGDAVTITANTQPQTAACFANTATVSSPSDGGGTPKSASTSDNGGTDPCAPGLVDATLTADRYNISFGGTSRLTWTTLNATDATLEDNLSGIPPAVVNLNDFKDVTLTQTTVFKLIARNTVGNEVERTATINVAPAPYLNKITFVDPATKTKTIGLSEIAPLKIRAQDQYNADITDLVKDDLQWKTGNPSGALGTQTGSQNTFRISGAFSGFQTFTVVVSSVNALGQLVQDQATITVVSAPVATGDICGAHAYPVPWKSTSGTDHVTFTGLAAGTIVRIFSSSAREIATLKSNAGEDVRWYLQNEKGSAVASWVYPYIIEQPNGVCPSRKGKLVIIR